jgi:hypothetical protein
LIPVNAWALASSASSRAKVVRIRGSNCLCRLFPPGTDLSSIDDPINAPGD